MLEMTSSARDSFSLIHAHTTEIKYGIIMKNQRGYLLYIANVQACICLRKGLLACRKKIVIHINLYNRYYSVRHACAGQDIFIERVWKENTRKIQAEKGR
jgi:hypothetical protein